MSKDALGNRIREVLKNYPVPSFEDTWSQAVRLQNGPPQEERRRLGYWTPIAVGAVFIIVLVTLLVPISPQRENETRLEIASNTFETGFDTDLGLASDQRETPDSGTRMGKLATVPPSVEELYELPTDFLLTMDMSAWQRTDEGDMR